MRQLAPLLRQWLQAGEAVALVRVVAANGSTPREAGAAMLVTQTQTAGTIGGGQAEYMAIDEARRHLVRRARAAHMELPLGPAIGQCCGGHLCLALVRADMVLLAALEQQEAAEQARWPHVYLFGAGHVGQALARALLPLPVQVHVVETRREQLDSLPDGVSRQLAAVPEAAVHTAPAGAAFIVLTHDHALDFLIAAAALARRDAAYVGLIGSASKRAAFTRWHAREGHDAAVVARLTCPLAPKAPRDKRPEVIAAFAAAEVMTTLLAAPVGDNEGGSDRARRYAKA